MAKVLVQRFRKIRLDEVTPHPENAREGNVEAIQDLIYGVDYVGKTGAAHTWHGGRVCATLIDDDDERRDLDSLKKAELVELLEDIRRTSTVIRENRPSRSVLHPTMKPVRLVSRLVSNSTQRGDILLDPFAGSGSTLIAAHHTGRVARLIELDPRYVDVICRRWQEHTSETPVLEATGEAHDFTSDE